QNRTSYCYMEVASSQLGKLVQCRTTASPRKLSPNGPQAPSTRAKPPIFTRCYNPITARIIVANIAFFQSEICIPQSAIAHGTRPSKFFCVSYLARLTETKVLFGLGFTNFLERAIGAPMVKLVVRDKETIQEAVRRFRKLVERSGIKKEMRRRE